MGDYYGGVGDGNGAADSAGTHMSEANRFWIGSRRCERIIEACRRELYLGLRVFFPLTSPTAVE